MDFEGWVAYGLIMLKFLIVAVYFYYYSSVKDEISKRAKDFYTKITILGLIYLLTDPILIMSSYLLHEWNR